ncbi:MAG: 16S rRNA (cytosine(1402)-N(4))-methyltransferase RsmH [Armatimonadetes bacterium]|nr:16S rRNA (cytosine(1402)-N(4))-methyltransferase RsmH [Armatimonadota bacterium]
MCSADAPVFDESGSAGAQAFHTPAMQEEVVAFLLPGGGGIWVDNTLGGGGHASLICARLSPDAIFIGIDRDPRALEAAGVALRSAKCRVFLRRAHFADAAGVIDDVRRQLGEMEAPVRGALWDLGLSSDQIDRGEGFSFADRSAKLDMRQDPDQTVTAAAVLNETPERQLADLIYQNADERLSRRVAAGIVKARPLTTMGELVDAVLRSLPRDYRQKDDVLRRTCQAVRIAVNGEFDQLQQSLADLGGLLVKGGRLVVLSYHSGEDRLVKRFFRQGRIDGTLEVLTPKPMRPDRAEIRENSRARSARLRAAQKL